MAEFALPTSLPGGFDLSSIDLSTTSTTTTASSSTGSATAFTSNNPSEILLQGLGANGITISPALSQSISDWGINYLENATGVPLKNRTEISDAEMKTIETWFSNPSNALAYASASMSASWYPEYIAALTGAVSSGTLVTPTPDTTPVVDTPKVDTDPVVDSVTDIQTVGGTDVVNTDATEPFETGVVDTTTTTPTTVDTAWAEYLSGEGLSEMIALWSTFNAQAPTNGTAAFIQATLAQAGSIAAATTLLAQDSTVVGTYSNLSNDDFIEQLYQNAFGRAADAAGKAHWVEQLNQGLTQTDVIAQFGLSSEKKGIIGDSLISLGSLTGVTATLSDELPNVAKIYQTLLGRLPDAEGALHWAKQMNFGLTASQIAESVISSTEFTNLLGTTADNSAFIEQLYMNTLGRSADATGKQYWLSVLDSGAERGALAEGFINSSEFGTLFTTGLNSLQSELQQSNPDLFA